VYIVSCKRDSHPLRGDLGFSLYQIYLEKRPKWGLLTHHSCSHEFATKSTCLSIILIPIPEMCISPIHRTESNCHSHPFLCGLCLSCLPCVTAREAVSFKEVRPLGHNNHMGPGEGFKARVYVVVRSIGVEIFTFSLKDPKLRFLSFLFSLLLATMSAIQRFEKEPPARKWINDNESDSEQEVGLVPHNRGYKHILFTNVCGCVLSSCLIFLDCLIYTNTSLTLSVFTETMGSFWFSAWWN
jgi:hypothetical protein